MTGSLFPIPAQKREEHVVKVTFSVSSISNFKILERPGSLQRPRTSCWSIFNPKKAFVHQQRKAHDCLSPFYSHLQRNFVFGRQI
jgi:hypothetical protein